MVGEVIVFAVALYGLSQNQFDNGVICETKKESQMVNILLFINKIDKQNDILYSLNNHYLGL